MNEQNNNMFSSMAQPSVMPEVKDNNVVSGVGQINGEVVQTTPVPGATMANDVNLGMTSSNTGMFDNQNNNVSTNLNMVNGGNVTDNFSGSNGSMNTLSFELPSASTSQVNNDVATVNVENENNKTSNQSNETFNGDDMAPVVSVKKYLGYIILFMIPVVGFVMLIVKALDKKDKNIGNYAKAQLLLSLISVILSVALCILVFALIPEDLTGSSNTIDDVYENNDYNYDYDYDYGTNDDTNIVDDTTVIDDNNDIVSDDTI